MHRFDAVHWSLNLFIPFDCVGGNSCWLVTAIVQRTGGRLAYSVAIKLADPSPGRVEHGLAWPHDYWLTGLIIISGSDLMAAHVAAANILSLVLISIWDRSIHTNYRIQSSEWALYMGMLCVWVFVSMLGWNVDELLDGGLSVELIQLVRCHLQYKNTHSPAPWHGSPSQHHITHNGWPDPNSMSVLMTVSMESPLEWHPGWLSGWIYLVKRKRSTGQ